MEMFIWAVTILLQRYAPPPGVIIKKRISVHTLRHYTEFRTMPSR
jgi:hypothetical protein